MAKTPKAYSHAEIKQMVSAVAHEAINANVHYKLFRSLRKKIRGYVREYNQTPAFWGLTMNAHLRAALSSLCLAYDTHPKGINLKRLMEMMRDSANKPWIAPDDAASTRSGATKAQFERDLKAVSKNDPLAKRLIWQRNNLFAHKNLDNVMNGGTDQAKFTLSHHQFTRLVDRAIRIVNRYGDIYIGNTWSRRMVGDDDYVYVLQAIRESVNSHERKIKAEIAEYKRLERAAKPRKR
jgi:hypothetical protein